MEDGGKGGSIIHIKPGSEDWTEETVFFTSVGRLANSHYVTWRN